MQDGGDRRVVRIADPHDMPSGKVSAGCGLLLNHMAGESNCIILGPLPERSRAALPALIVCAEAEPVGTAPAAKE